MKNLCFLPKAWLCLCLFGLVMQSSCAVAKPETSTDAHTWRLSVLLDKGTKLIALDNADFNIVKDDSVIDKKSYQFVLHPLSLQLLEALKAKLLSMGALKVEIFKIEH